ncbi:class I tRNA ligase family protein [Bacillus licheniformis]|nr:class I tRNA ligase family protein [Bacillus licheniformis]
MKDFRGELLEAVKETKWVPEWGETRLYNMIRDRGDWCISRQRAWGVPIPVFMRKREPIITDETINHVSELFREHGSNIWFEKKRMNCFRKALLTLEARTASLQRAGHHGRLV